ncbi:hypothetical protein D9M70_466460 [compost metagenome]
MHQRHFTLVRQSRRFTRMVVPGHHQHSPMGMGAGDVAVPERIAGTVDTRTFSVPDGEHTVLVGLGGACQHLCAPDRGGCQVFVDPRLEQDIMLFQQLSGTPQLLVVAAQGRTAVAGNEAGSVQAVTTVQLPLNHRDTHEGLGPGHQYLTGLGGVFVIQLHVTHGFHFHRGKRY